MDTALIVLAAALVCGSLAVFCFLRPASAMLVLTVMLIWVPVDLGGKVGDLPRLGPTRLVLAAFLFGFALNAMLNSSGSRVSARPRLLVLPVSLYLASQILSGLFSVAPLESVYAIVDQFCTPFALFYIVAGLVKQSGFRSRLERVVFIGTVGVCLLALYEAISLHNPLMRFIPDAEMAFRGGLPRVRSTFFHPIALGAYLGLVYPFYLARLADTRHARRLVIAAALGFVLVTSLLTVSRGPWIALMLGTVAIAAVWPRTSRQRLALAAVATGLAALCVATLGTSTLAIGRLVNPSELNLGTTVEEASSEYYRIALVQGVTERLTGARWLVGFGPGSFLAADVNVVYDRARHTLTAPDSHYAKVLLESGLVGLAAFLVLLGAATRVCVRAVRRTIGVNRMVATACLASTMGFMWSNVTASLFLVYPLAFLFWAAVAIAGSLEGGNETRRAGA